MTVRRQRLPEPAGWDRADRPLANCIGLGVVLWAAGAVANAQAPSQPATAPVDHAGHQTAETGTNHGHSMHIDSAGVVMNENTSTLPRDCEAISRDHEFMIRAGRAFAADFPGAVYGFSQYELQAEPCSRITVHLVNEDAVRHQWMVHGLPRYLYPAGMFHIEATGGQTRSGTFIVPSDDRTYLIHCDIPQHMERGMKAQLVVGRGSGDLWGIPGISGNFERDAYPPGGRGWLAAAAAALGLALTVLALWWRGSR